MSLFDAADLAVQRGSDRDYHASIDDPRIDRVMFLRPQEIPEYVEQGLFDVGITGRDWIVETNADVVTVCELAYSKTTANPVRIVLAVPRDHPADAPADLPDGVRVSTEFPQLTRRYFDDLGVKAVIVPSYGATEAKVPNIVDAIVDLTETGTSLAKHGLRILDTLLTSRTELVTNATAYADSEKRRAIDDIALLLQGAIRARANVYLMLNVSSDRLDAVLGVLPSMGSPTVTSLANGDHAVASVVPKVSINELIPALRAAGGRDILELPISKIVE
jgi:ATP phosphoribosyltransferase